MNKELDGGPNGCSSVIVSFTKCSKKQSRQRLESAFVGSRLFGHCNVE